MGAVSIYHFGEGKYSNVLAIELGRTLRPHDAAKPRAEQDAQSKPSQHSVLPIQVSLADDKEQSPLAAAPFLEAWTLSLHPVRTVSKRVRSVRSARPGTDVARFLTARAKAA